MNNEELFKDVHWIMDALQSIDTGLVVLDRNYQIQLWNSFMQNHSAIMPSEAMGKSLFELFPELPENWFKRKVQSVFVLRNAAFTTWEQRPYLFRFKNYRPITGTAKHMYQNSTIVPLSNVRGEVDHICLIVYDVTDTAANKLALKSANSQLEEMSRTDSLTKLYNRGHWESCLDKEFARFKRYGTPCSLIMFDIDHFKRINDNYGHPTGDVVIREAADEIRAQVRDLDIAGRYGGEEFGILLPDTPAEGALHLAERLRMAIEALEVHHDEQTIKFTVSLGVSETQAEYSNYTQWLEQADQALYASKEAGRNTTSIL